MVDKCVLKDLIHYLLVCDEEEYRNERVRVQLALSMFLMAYTGSRPGAIVEPSYWPGLNDGLLYKDCEVIFSGAEICVRITFRNRKNRRAENKS